MNAGTSDHLRPDRTLSWPGLNTTVEVREFREHHEVPGLEGDVKALKDLCIAPVAQTLKERDGANAFAWIDLSGPDDPSAVAE